MITYEEQYKQVQKYVEHLVISTDTLQCDIITDLIKSIAKSLYILSNFKYDKRWFEDYIKAKKNEQECFEKADFLLLQEEV